MSGYCSAHQGHDLLCPACNSVPDLIDPKDKRIAELELAARDAADLLDQLWMETRRYPRSLIPILTAANKLKAAIGRPQSSHGKQF